MDLIRQGKRRENPNTDWSAVVLPVNSTSRTLRNKNTGRIPSRKVLKMGIKK